MRKLGVDKWLLRVVQAMYTNARSRVIVKCRLSEGFMIKVGVQQRSVLIPLFFIMVRETLSREIISGCPQELIYAGDFVPIAENMEELIEKFKKWKDGMETKGLRINMKKTKIMVTVTLGQ